MFRKMLSSAAVVGSIGLAGGLFGAVSASASMPSGQVMFGNTSFSTSTGTFTGGGGTIEPAYNDANGSLVYLSTPNGAQAHPNAHNVAPLYLTVYPTSSGIDPASLNCAHVPADNCPDHGPLIAGAAMGAMPSVYGGGVAGHDHLVGIASTGGDFNVLWEPVIVLFTNAQAATNHITTLSALDAAVSSGNAIEIPLPQATFHCASVSAAAYARGIPSPTVVGP